MASLLFIAAGTLHYWQAWLFLATYFAPSLAITVYLMKKDPALLARRMSGGPFAEKEPVQKVVMSIASLCFVGLIVLPAIDHRVGWTVDHARPVCIARRLLAEQPPIFRLLRGRSPRRSAGPCRRDASSRREAGGNDGLSLFGGRCGGALRHRLDTHIPAI
jgi:hypothetical protein